MLLSRSVLLMAALALTLVTAHAQMSGRNTGGEASKSETAGSPPSGKLNYQADMFTGRFGYSVPFQLPPGRNGTEPPLGLRYSSSDGNGWCGLGWELEGFGFIERETKRGVPIRYSSTNALAQYEDAKSFNFSLGGVAAALVNTSPGEYRAEVESAFMRFYFNVADNRWEVTDKSGTKYYFGEAAGSRMSNTKTGWSPGAAQSTFRWALNRIQTARGDTASIVYTNISGNLYPLIYAYNGHTAGLTNTHSVEFQWQDRGDVRMSLISGYRIDVSKRLTNVLCKVSGNLVRRYQIAYTPSPSTGRSLLQSVTTFGSDNTTSLPPLSFGYQVKPMAFEATELSWTNLYIPVAGATWRTPTVYSGSSTLIGDLIDIDGDGLPDRVTQKTSVSYTNFMVQKNTGAGFANPISWGPYFSQNYSNDQAWAAINSANTRFIDINGDNLPDRVSDRVRLIQSPYTNFLIDFNTGTGFGGLSSFNNVNPANTTPNGNPTSEFEAVENNGSVRMLDMNGDGFPDRVMRRADPPYTNYYVQFNLGTAFTATCVFGPIGNQGATSVQSLGGTGSDMVWLSDINGDGLPDRVMVPYTPGVGMPTGSNFNKFSVEFNNGSGFEAAVDWTTVHNPYLTPTSTTPEYQTVDNGTTVGLLDINGDDLPDRVMVRSTQPYTVWIVQLNTGSGFAAPFDYAVPSSQGQTSDKNWCSLRSSLVSLVDMNGDGLIDRVMRHHGMTVDKLVVTLNAGPFPDLLWSVTNSMGGGISIGYAPSTRYDNSTTNGAAVRNLLPFPINTVTAVSAYDGLTSRTTLYNYSGGFWDSTRREFNGFSTVWMAEPGGVTTRHLFHQGGGRDGSAEGEFQDSGAFGKRGMLYRSDTYGADSLLYKIVVNKVSESVTNGQRFSFTAQSIDIDCPGTYTGYRATAQQFQYNLLNGNLTNVINLGEVTNIDSGPHTFTDVGSDSTYTYTVFASLTNTDIQDKPSSVRFCGDQNQSQILRETLYGYDNATGNLTQTRDRICAGSYGTNTFTYDSYGNQHTATNEVGIVSTSTYDSTYQTLLVQTRIGTFTNSSIYSPYSGLLLSSTDAKGLITSNSYDTFFRLTNVLVSATPNGSPNVWIARYQYSQGGFAAGISGNSVRSSRSDDVDTSNGLETWTYFDGVGRPIQVRHEAETNGFRVTDTVYDVRGNVTVDTLSYFSSGSGFTKPASSQSGTYHEYDSMGRLNKLTKAATIVFNPTTGLFQSATVNSGDASSPLGTGRLDYVDGSNPWAVVRTDEEGKVHKYLLDGYGRTNQIVEVMSSGGNFTSTLRYDKAGAITNIVDHLNNTIEFAYNDLGQIVASSDPNLGIWKYRRDNAGRLAEQTDAATNLVHFNYNDPLGRLVSRQVYDRTGAYKYGVTNIYDSSDDGNFTVYSGQLFKVIDGEGWEKLGYDVRGRGVKKARYLSKNSEIYTNTFVYDNADRVRTNLYPAGGPTVRSTYDSGGNLSEVRRIDGTNVVFYTAQGFNALGQVTGASFGNGTVCNYGYYPVSKRLQNVTTAKSGGATYQNLTYTFDRVANLKGIVDGVYSGAASAAISSIQYDDLHRLTSLKRSGVGLTTPFTYNAIGNFGINGENGGGAYNYGSRMPHAVKSANGKRYAYDRNGNMIVRGTQVLGYDSENRLTTVITGTNTVTFGYSGGGERLWKHSTNGVQVWIGGSYEEKDGKILFHISAAERLVCTFDKTETNVFEYYHSDHIQSTSVLTDRNGDRIQHHEYSAFGRERFTENATAFHLSRRYTGQVLDEETGLYFYNARYYDSELGRFVQPDSIIPDAFDPQAYNRYAYVRNNPLRYTDPTGHAWYDYIPGIGPGIAQYQGQQAVDSAAIRAGDRLGTGWQSYHEMMGDLRPGKTLTAGNVSAVSGAAMIAAGATYIYINGVQEIATAGISSPAVTVSASRMGEAPSFLARVFGKEGKNFTKELELTEHAARRHLRRSVDGSGGQAHHLIPWDLRNHDLIKKAAEGGFNINGANNGIRLGEKIHLGPHGKYNAAVGNKLDNLSKANPNASPQEAAKMVQGFADQLRKGIERTSNKLK